MKRRNTAVPLLLLLLLGLTLSLPVSGQGRDGPLRAPSSVYCPPLSDPVGDTIVDVSTVAELLSAVNNGTSHTTIRVADGTYALHGSYLWLDVPHVTLRSASGNREAVILDGNYESTEIVTIAASDVTVADLTIKRAGTHPIHVVSADDGDTVNTLIYNVHLIDPREQAIKINPAVSGYYPDEGVIACSHLELTDEGRPHVNPTAGGCYTGGVDAHQARGWVIRDNLIEGFWCPSGLSEHGIHMWRGCRDTTVERNVLNNNARGIGLGLVTSGSGRTYADDPCPGASGYVDDYGGVIRNNFVFANSAGLFASQSGFDSGIALWNSCGARVLHNTVASTQTPSASSIEWRFDNTDVELVNNLVTYRLLDRGGTASLSGNLAYQPLSLFVDGPGGDLHLAATATDAIDAVAAPSDVSDDIDGDARPVGAASDVGADEYRVAAPAAVNDLYVSEAITHAATLTATLRWTPPADAVTTTLRYSDAVIGASDWDGAVTLTDTLPGDGGVFTAVVPYAGATTFFALKTQNAGGAWSDLSNNAFWPRSDVWLPVVLR